MRIDTTGIACAWHDGDVQVRIGSSRFARGQAGTPIHNLVICQSRFPRGKRNALDSGKPGAGPPGEVLKTYFVRKAANREVVGLFVAPSLTLLAALVDECCDPAACEYALAQTGGLLLAQTTAKRWPLSGHEQARGTVTGLEGAVLSQQWEDDLGFADSALEWKPLASAAVRMIRSLGAGKSPDGNPI